ncbi:minor capsid protein [Cryobacterium sp. Y11]|uniref:minor capsid protein n=1 Tax=Cryobacterium sp. Y11 TaxID=2045016 RepID=UPI001E2FDC86|nr:minor capsid protein [Cryobacterium sp. Y11]
MPPLDDRTLTILICSILGEIPGWDWNPGDPDYVYSSDPVIIFYGALGTTPDTAVGVRVYAAGQDLDVAWRRVQIRVRGAQGRPDGADVLAALAFAALQGLSRVGGISGISRLSIAPAGADDNRREERTENYLIILDNLEALT